jgi:hypothetical protein
MLQIGIQDMYEEQNAPLLQQMMVLQQGQHGEQGIVWPIAIFSHA